MTHPTTLTSPTHTGTLKPKGWPQGFYWIVPELVSTYGPFRYVDTGQLVPKVWDVEQEKEACRSGQSASSASPPSSSLESPTQPSSSGATAPAPSDPLRWGCRVVPCGHGYDVRFGDLYLSGYDSYVEWNNINREEIDAWWPCYESRDEALSALNHPYTPPPPGWKAEQPVCDCGKIEHGRHHALCPASGVKHSEKAEKPASTGLRAAHEVVRDVMHPGSANRCVDPYAIVTADRVAVLENLLEDLDSDIDRSIPAWVRIRIQSHIIRTKGQT